MIASRDPTLRLGSQSSHLFNGITALPNLTTQAAQSIRWPGRPQAEHHRVFGDLNRQAIARFDAELASSLARQRYLMLCTYLGAKHEPMIPTIARREASC
jgi:hypothetical protein